MTRPPLSPTAKCSPILSKEIAVRVSDSVAFLKSLSPKPFMYTQVTSSLDGWLLFYVPLLALLSFYYTELLLPSISPSIDCLDLISSLWFIELLADDGSAPEPLEAYLAEIWLTGGS